MSAFGITLFFNLQINVKAFYKVVVPFLVGLSLDRLSNFRILKREMFLKEFDGLP